MSPRPYAVRGVIGSSQEPGQSGRAVWGADRLPGAAGQTARDRTRLQASEAAVASDVIEFQLARQRIGLTSPATIAEVIAAYFATGDSIPAVLYFPTLFIGIALLLGWS